MKKILILLLLLISTQLFSQINVGTNFQITGQLPIDNRTVFSDSIQRNLLPINYRYDGLTTYTVSDHKYWKLTGGIYNSNWSEFNSSPTTDGLTVWGSGTWQTSITNNSTNWNAAFGWGNHATAGYEIANNKKDYTSTSSIFYPTWRASKYYMDSIKSSISIPTYLAGFGLGINNFTFYNSRYWGTQDSVKTSLNGLLLSTNGKLTTITNNSTTWNSAVPNTRTISTTSPLMGGGDLSVNRTFYYNTDSLAALARRKDTTTLFLSKIRATHDYQPKGTYVVPSDLIYYWLKVDTNDIKKPITYYYGNSHYFAKSDSNTQKNPITLKYFNDHTTTYSAGYGLGLSSNTFYNSRYWKGQDTLKTTLTGIVLATAGKLSTITDNSSSWNGKQDSTKNPWKYSGGYTIQRTASSNVGIGTNTPSYPLHIYTTNNLGLYVQSTYAYGIQASSTATTGLIASGPTYGMYGTGTGTGRGTGGESTSSDGGFFTSVSGNGVYGHSHTGWAIRGDGKSLFDTINLSSKLTSVSDSFLVRDANVIKYRKVAFGAGSVTNVATGLGLSGGPISTSGTIVLDTANASVLSRQRALHEYQLKGSYLTSLSGAWLYPDTSTNKKLAAYYTTMTAIGQRSLPADTGVNKKFAAYYWTTQQLAGKQPSGTYLIPSDTSSLLLSRLRAGHDYQAKGTYLTSITQGTPTNITIAGTSTIPTIAVDTSNASILGRTRAANTYQPKGSYVTGTPWTGMGYLTTAVTSVGTGLGLTGGTITTTGTVSVDTASLSILSRQRAVNTYQPKLTAGYRMGISGITINNTSYWKNQDTVKTSLTGLLLATTGKLTTVTDNSSNWNTAYGWGNHSGLYWLKSDTTTTLETKTYNNSKLSLKVPTSRTISTTSPIIGGGDLTANRTIYIHTDTLASWARRKDTATLLLSRTRASHDYQVKGSYVTGTPWTGLYWAYADTNSNKKLVGYYTYTQGLATKQATGAYLLPSDTGSLILSRVRAGHDYQIKGSYLTTAVTSVATGMGLTGGTITTTGTVSIDTANASILSRQRALHEYQPKGSYGTGTVTNITMGYGLSSTQSPLTTTGTMKADSTVLWSTVRASHLSSYPTLNQNTTGQSGSVANALTNGYGLNTFTYNGSAAISPIVDTTKIVSTVRMSHISSYPTLNQSTTGNAATATTATQVGHTLGNGYGISSLSFTGASNGTIIADSSVLWSTVRASHLSSYPTLNQNTTGQAGSVANSLTNGYGITSLTYNGSSAKTAIIDTSVVVSTVRFGHLSAYPTLNQSTTGQAGSVANSLTNGLGISTLIYNGSSAKIITVDTSSTTILSRQRAANTYQVKGLYVVVSDTSSLVLSRLRASHDYQPKGSYLTSNGLPNVVNFLQVKVADSNSTATGGYVTPKGLLAKGYITSNGLPNVVNYLQVKIADSNSTATGGYVTPKGLTAKGYITGNQTITLGGIISGSGTTSITTSAGSGYYMPSTTDQTNWNANNSKVSFPGFGVTHTTAAYGDTVAAHNTRLIAKAPIASPTFTGTVTGTFSGNLTGNVTGTATGLSAQYIDWNQTTGPTSIANKPTLTSGTITSIATTSPIIGGTISSSGTIAINTDSLASWARRKDTASIFLSRTRASHDYQVKGSYLTTAVTSVATGYGVSGGTISTTGTITADTTSSNALVSKVRFSHPSAYPILNQNTTGTANNISLSATVGQSLRYISGAWRAWADSLPNMTLYAPIASPTFTGTVTLPTGLNGILKATSGVVSTITDNSTNWNTAYGWGNWSHTTLSGYGITDAWSKSDTTSTLETKTYNNSKLALKVPTSRTISTTSPLMGGGDLTSNRTFYINTDTLAAFARRKDTATLLLSRTRASHDYQPKGSYLSTAVTSVATGLGLSGGTITTTGTIVVDTASTSILSRQRAVNTYQPKGVYAVPGDTSINKKFAAYYWAVQQLAGKQATGAYLLPSDTGSLLLSKTRASHDYQIKGSYEPSISKSTGFLKWTGSAWSWDNSTYVTGTPWTGMGYLTSAVTSIATGYGTSGGTITSTGTIIADTTGVNALVSKVRLSHPSTYPTLNQNTTGTAAGLTSQYIDWNATSGGNSIANKPTLTSGTVTSVATGLGLSGGTITSSGTIIVDTASTSIISRQRASNTYQVKGSYLTTTLSSGNILVGNGSNIATALAPSGDVTISNAGVTTIINGSVTLAKQANLSANSIIGNNTGSSATPIALTITNVRNMINANYYQENFETTADSSAHYTFSLSHTPLSNNAVTVILNGLPLNPATSQYAIIMTNKIRISLPSYIYDKVSISYNY